MKSNKFVFRKIIINKVSYAYKILIIIYFKNNAYIYVVNHVSISQFILHSSHFIMNKLQREKKLMNFFNKKNHINKL